MNGYGNWVHTMLTTVVVGALIGCGQSSPPETPPPPSAPQGASPVDGEVDAALAKLPPAEAQAARAQGTCPVSGEPLGSMGVPIKVTVGGRDVYICCEGCRDELTANFDEYANRTNPAPEPD